MRKFQLGNLSILMAILCNSFQIIRRVLQSFFNTKLKNKIHCYIGDTNWRNKIIIMIAIHNLKKYECN